MKVTTSMIKKELRAIGFFRRLLTLNPTVFMFKASNFIEAKTVGKNLDGYQCDTKYITSRDGETSIRVRLYRRKKSDDEATKLVPGVLCIHGGGFAGGYPESTHFSINRILSKQDCVVVNPDYRRSLDAPYPAAVYDCYDTLAWMVKNHASLGIRTNQIFLYGSSAGGTLVCALALMARDLGKIKIAYQMPLYPALDDRMTTSSMKNNNAPEWNEKANLLAWNLYLKGTNRQEVPYYAAPARCTDLSDLPPASTFVGDIDPLHDEIVEYFDRLKASGITANIKTYKGCYHAFQKLNPNCDASRDALAFVDEELDYAFRNYFVEQPK